MLGKITPVILTYNEAPNIGRTLERLTWASDIVLVDSFSTDATLEIASRFQQVRVFQRQFTTHQEQWSFALAGTEIHSEWVLALDADYVLPDDFVNELKTLSPTSSVGGYRSRFTYCVHGKPIRSGVYPSVNVLYRRDDASYEQDGHTQKVVVHAPTIELHSPILHDDRKSLSSWVESQSHYVPLEAQKLLGADPKSLAWTDRIRRWRIVAPVAMPLYCLLIRGGILDGRAGFYYAFQRMLAELLLSLYLIDADLRSSADAGTPAKVVEPGSSLLDAKEGR